MSDYWIALIPEDPQFVPTVAHQKRARDRFLQLAPEADEIEIKVTDFVQFFDCGENFARVICPSCRAEIPNDWWQDRLDDDSADVGFKLTPYATPCCRSPHTLHELIYDWPQGFGRFAIDAMNPNIGKLTEEQVAEFETILNTPLRVVYQHI